MRLQRQGRLLVWSRRRSCQLSFPLLSKLLICAALLLVAIGYTTWTANLQLTTDPRLPRRQKRSSSKSRVYTVREILNFPKDYHAKGVLSLPYGDIVEPFEAWYSERNKMSRIDYYGGMDQTYQRETLGKHGFACKVVPEYSEKTQKIFRGCLHRRGTKRFPVKAQSIVPKSHYFRYVGDVTLRGHRAAKWEHQFTIYNKVNTYVLYTTKTRHVKPLRYEMLGYDTLLSSYYDHYVLDYELFESWNFNYSTFQIPTDLDCFDFSRKKFAHIVGELNPMLEFMPHTDNGAPFTFSHDPSIPNDFQRQDGFEKVNNPLDTSSFPSEGLDASFNVEGGLSDDSKTTLPTSYNRYQQSNDRTAMLRNDGSSLNYIPRGSTGATYTSNGEGYGQNTNWNTNANPNVDNQPGLNENFNRDEHKDFFEGKQPDNRQPFETGKLSQAVHKSAESLSHQKFNRKAKIHSGKGTKRRMHRGEHKTHKAKSLHSWGGLQHYKHEDKEDLTKHHSLSIRHSSKKRKNHKSPRDSPASGHNYSILRKNYEDIVNLLFDAFKMDHSKVYSSDHEHETRKDIYRHNLRFIKSRNRMHLGYKLRPNHLMDMTDYEIQKQKGLLKEDENMFNGGVPFKPISHHFPKFVDWRKRGAVNSVKSQGICGSCYAYAVTGALEGAYFLKNGHLPDFSEQEIIDCSWGFGNRGCKGGYPYRAMQWILKHGGLATDDSYGKYLAQEGYCHFKNVSVGVKVDTYMNISKGNATELKQALAQYGPVSVLVSTQPKSFKFYSSGIYYDPECGDNLDHAALAVGYGEHNGTPYWLVKNSWSRAWGDSGYIKIAQRNNNCGVTSKAVVVRIK